MRPGHRDVIGGLGGTAAAIGFAVGAVSLTRIAGDYLGFPDGLFWTLTGAVDVAGTAGAIMWTRSGGQVRSIGRAMNIVCTAISGVGVGLDHATHSGHALRNPNAAQLPLTDPRMWAVTAFLVGLFLPFLSTWILHGLAVAATRLDATRREGRETETPTTTPTETPVETPTETPFSADREAASRPPDREPLAIPAAQTGTLVATTGTPDREPVPAGSRDGDDTGPLPRIHLAKPQPPWAPDDLVRDVIAEIRSTEGGRRNFGQPKLIGRELPDGDKIGSKRATDLLAHVDEVMARQRMQEPLGTSA